MAQRMGKYHEMILKNINDKGEGLCYIKEEIVLR